MRRTAAGMVLALLEACHPSGSGDWIRPQLAPHVRFVRSTTPDSLDVWRSDGDVLRLTNETSKSQIQKELKDSKLVMVSFASDSDLASTLRSDPHTLAFFSRDRGRTNLALVAIPDILAANELSIAAHASSGHMCGAVTPVALTGLALMTDTLTPALYPEAAPLTAAEAMLAKVDVERLASSVKTLEAMGTRFHSSETGLATTAKVKELFQAAAGPETADANFSEIDHRTTTATQPTDQKSLVVTLPGQTDDTTTVIVGAHLDSINRASPDAPGADDDASGVATLVEIFRVIAASGAKFHRRVELHAYAGEEIGLVGSQHIASLYRAADRKVSAMMQIDMNSWSRDPARQTIHLVSTDTHGNLRRSVKDLLNAYLSGDFTEKALAAGTSDHRAWTNAGFPAVFPFEDPDDYNRALHTANDTSTTANNLGLTKRFTQLALAFIAHHAGLVDDAAGAAKTALRSTLPSDLKLAVMPTVGKSGWIDVSIATTGAAASVDFCVIAEAGSLGCTRERIAGTAAKTVGGRSIFSPTKSLEMSAGGRLAVFAFDAADRLIAYRTVKLAAKP